MTEGPATGGWGLGEERQTPELLAGSWRSGAGEERDIKSLFAVSRTAVKERLTVYQILERVRSASSEFRVSSSGAYSYEGMYVIGLPALNAGVKMSVRA
jgi:hypothetical protein